MDGPRVVVQLALPSVLVIPDRTALGHVTVAQPELLLLENSGKFSVVHLRCCRLQCKGNWIVFVVFFCILTQKPFDLDLQKQENKKKSSSKKRLANIDRFLHCSSSMETYWVFLMSRKKKNIK